MVRSVQGETSQAQAGCSRLPARSRLMSAAVSPAPALSPPMAIWPAENPSTAQECPGFQRVVIGGGKGMFRREPVLDRKRPRPCRASRLGHHPPMAHDRARAISAAVKEEQHIGGIAARNDRPFAFEAIDVDRLELDVAGDRPDRANLLDALPPLLPPDRPGLALQKVADGVDFTLGHQWILGKRKTQNNSAREPRSRVVARLFM